MIRGNCTIFLVLIALFCSAQTDSLHGFSFSMYGELYYSYDFANPENHERPNFLYNHKRHNEVNINMLLMKANYIQKDYRANLGFMVGNYAQYNLSSEPTWAQFINEANVGVKLSDKSDLWLDIGIMPSHIGFESAISADCWTLTRSMLAENSPYFETGIKLSYTTADKKLLVSLMYLNGWQKITKPDGFQRPSFGGQLNYKASDRLTFNYSNFIGSDRPDSLNAFRQFHNVYCQFEPNERFGIIAGFDIGFEKTQQLGFVSWYSPVIIVRQKIDQKTKIALRGEYYSDAENIIIRNGSSKGFHTLGLSANVDFDINDNLLVRAEGKLFHSKEKIFDEGTSQRNVAFTTSLNIRL